MQTRLFASGRTSQIYKKSGSKRAQAERHLLVQFFLTCSSFLTKPGGAVNQQSLPIKGNNPSRARPTIKEDHWLILAILSANWSSKAASPLPAPKRKRARGRKAQGNWA
jgi:hypothetical protein